MGEPKFHEGERVFKTTGDYTGPGFVRGITTLPNGKTRYLVGHKVEGGEGEFLHVYAEGNLRRHDKCEMADCSREGMYGNENVIAGSIVCDYCHAKMMKP